MGWYPTRHTSVYVCFFSISIFDQIAILNVKHFKISSQVFSMLILIMDTNKSYEVNTLTDTDNILSSKCIFPHAG